MENKNSFWESMWLFLVVLVLMSLVYNIVEGVIDAIKRGDWVRIIIWIIVIFSFYYIANYK